MNSVPDQAVTVLAHDFVAGLDKLNAEPYIREAIMKIAVREMAWAMLEAFDNQHELADQLELMARVIRES